MFKEEKMNYNTIVQYLSGEMGIEERQVKRSFNTTSALKGINNQEASYTPNQIDADEYIHQCGGKIPLKMYKVDVIDGKKNRTIHTYSHKMVSGGLEKTMITTSKAKTPQLHIWDI
jgi:hypothetical protein